MSIADFLLTPRQQRLLAPLLLNPSLRLRVSELLTLSGSGRGATQKHIQAFVDIGLLLKPQRISSGQSALPTDQHVVCAV